MEIGSHEEPRRIHLSTTKFVMLLDHDCRADLTIAQKVTEVTKAGETILAVQEVRLLNLHCQRCFMV